MESNQRGEETRSNEEENLFQRSQIEVHMNVCGIVSVWVFTQRFVYFVCMIERIFAMCSQRI